MKTKLYCLIAPFDAKTQSKVDKIKKVLNKNKIETCKVGFNVGVVPEKRNKMDSLPTHITLCIWSEINKALINNLELRIKKYRPFKLSIDSFDFFNKEENVLYFKPAANKQLADIQKDVYTIVQNEYFPPLKWKPHATLLINNNKEEFDAARKLMKILFAPFEAKIDELILCEVYPKKVIKVIKL